MISFCHININSIIKHKDELLARFSKNDVISVNETNLASDKHFVLPRYNVFRHDRIGKSGSGVLLAVKQHIRSREIINKTSNNNEMVAVEIVTKTYGSILISSIYVPPKAKTDIKILHELHTLNNNCVIMGDFNATPNNLGSQLANARGRRLQELLNEGLIEGVDDDSPTFERNDSEVKLDWILASQPLISNITNVETHPTIDTLNGHKPITYDMPLGIEPTEDIEEYAVFIRKCIVAATHEAIPQNKQTNTIFTPSETSSNLIKDKHQAYRRWKKTGNEADKRRFYNSKVLLTNSLRSDRRNSFNKLMSLLCQKKMYSDKVWLTVHKFHNKHIKQIHSGIMKYNNKTAVTDKEKADLFANYFENEVYTHTADSLTFHDQVTDQANNVKNGVTPMSNTLKWKKMKVEEVKLHIRQFRNSSTGPDNVHNRCLKNDSKLLVQHVIKLFNAILNSGHIPAMWNKANIIVLLLLEKTIKQRLMIEIERRNILPQHQAGFRQGKSTTYNIVRLERFAEATQQLFYSTSKQPLIQYGMMA